MRSAIRWFLSAVSIVSCLVPLAASADDRGDDPVIDNSSTSRKLDRMARPAGERISVGIYEFRSEVPEINARMAADMFTTALVRSGQFTVVERSRISQGVMREKQMNAAGQTTGQTAQAQLTEARYIFEGTVSEANREAAANKGAVTMAGARVGGGTGKDQIAIDVRVVDVNSGQVLEAVAVRKDIESSQAEVSGLGALASKYLESRGKTVSPFMPEVEASRGRKQSVDAALRSCIDLAVHELATRLQRPQ